MKKSLNQIKWIRIILFVLFVLALVIVVLGYRSITGKVIELISNLR